MEFSLRPPEIGEIKAIVEMINDTCRRDTGSPKTSTAEKESEWNSSLISRETDIRIAVTGKNEICGYAEAWNLDPFVEANVWGCVHPDYRGLGIGGSLVDWGLQRAKSSVEKAPEGAKVAMHLWAPDVITDAGLLFQSRGFKLVRHFIRMKRTWGKNSPPEGPQWPDGILLRKYRGTEDNQPLYSASDDAFKDHWGYVPEGFEGWQEWLAAHPSFTPELYLIAVEKNSSPEQIAGGALCFPTFDEDPDSGYIDTIFVNRRWRRKGLASALLKQAFSEYHQRGVYSACLGVDAASLTGAVDLYTKAGMEPVRTTDVYQLELRPGWKYEDNQPG